MLKVELLIYFRITYPKVKQILNLKTMKIHYLLLWQCSLGNFFLARIKPGCFETECKNRTYD